MKTSDFKKLITEAVREVFREEIKEIILEAVKSNKGASNITETNTIPPIKSKADQMQAYADIMNNMTFGNNSMNFNTQNMSMGNPGFVNTSTEGSSLPNGEVGLDQIMKLTGR